MGFPGGTVAKDWPAIQEPQQRRIRLLGQADSPGEGIGNPLQDSCLENPLDGAAWWATYSPWGPDSDTTERLAPWLIPVVLQPKWTEHCKADIWEQTCAIVSICPEHWQDASS